MNQLQLTALTKRQFQDLDVMCENIGLSTTLLMENAGKISAEYIKLIINNERLKMQNKEINICIIVGPGNNGGDGLVIARHLVNYDFKVRILLTEPEDKYIYKENAVSLNYKIAKNLNIPMLFWDELGKQEINSVLKESNIVVDAIFGIGLSRPLSLKYIDIIKTINEDKTNRQVNINVSGENELSTHRPTNTLTIFSVDIPSGLDADTGQNYGETVKADYTLSFTAYKKCFFLESCKHYLGHIEILDIGIPKRFILITP